MDELSVGVELYTWDAQLDIVRRFPYNTIVVSRQEALGFDKDDVFVDIHGAAVLTRMGVDYIQRLCKRGVLRAVKIQGRWYISIMGLGEWRRKHSGRGRPPAGRDADWLVERARDAEFYKLVDAGEEAVAHVLERLRSVVLFKLVDAAEVDTSVADGSQSALPGLE